MRSQKKITSSSDDKKDSKEKPVPLCRYLDWDSNFFGFRIARVEKQHLSPEEMLEILAWCRQHKIDCLYFLADSRDSDSIRLVEDYKFNLVDVKVTLDRKLDGEIKDENILMGQRMRPGREDDLPTLRQIAGSSFVDTRFYNDPHFPRHRCDALYETWIAESFKSLADIVLVAEMEGEPAGFITCKLDKNAQGEIGLLGVSSNWQGRGIGIRLLNGGLGWFANHHVERVTVVTQGRNIPAQRLYQRCKFQTFATQLWYHKWFEVL